MLCCTVIPATEILLNIKNIQCSIFIVAYNSIKLILQIPSQGSESAGHTWMSTAVEAVDYSVSPSGCLTAGTYCVGDWVGSRATVDAVFKTQIPDHAGNVILDVQTVASHINN